MGQRFLEICLLRAPGLLRQCLAEADLPYRPEALFPLFNGVLRVAGAELRAGYTGAREGQTAGNVFDGEEEEASLSPLPEPKAPQMITEAATPVPSNLIAEPSDEYSPAGFPGISAPLPIRQNPRITDLAIFYSGPESICSFWSPIPVIDSGIFDHYFPSNSGYEPPSRQVAIDYPALLQNPFMGAVELHNSARYNVDEQPATFIQLPIMITRDPREGTRRCQVPATGSRESMTSSKNKLPLIRFDMLCMIVTIPCPLEIGSSMFSCSTDLIHSTLCACTCAVDE
jgi:hypothetical protein